MALLLPLLLKPGALGKMPQKQKENIRAETGESASSRSRPLQLMPAQPECRCAGRLVFLQFLQDRPVSQG